jgi:translation initiation factor IF-3
VRNSQDGTGLAAAVAIGRSLKRWKAKRASEWLAEGHRVKVELFLRGRIKSMGKEFLQERLQRIIDEITTEHKNIDGFKESPKGIVVTLERIQSKK